MSALAANFSMIRIPSGCFKLMPIDFLPQFIVLAIPKCTRFYKTNDIGIKQNVD